MKAKAATTFLLLLGIVFAAGWLTYTLLPGMNYFDHESESCVSCHSMQAAFDSWSKDPHSKTASCQDCHFPNDWLPRKKLQVANALSRGRAEQKLGSKVHIVLDDKALETAQSNCLSCHKSLFELPDSFGHGEGKSCSRCHANVGHDH